MGKGEGEIRAQTEGAKETESVEEKERKALEAAGSQREKAVFQLFSGSM